MAKQLDIFQLALRVAPYLLGFQKQEQQKPTTVLDTKDAALINLRNKDGAVVLILGKRESGKTILSHRLAEFLGRPTYAITPNQHPPQGIKEIKLEEIETVPPNSTLILDDLPVYMSSRDYTEKFARSVEKLIPIVRHKKIMLIFISQTSGFADRWVMDADAIFIKQMSLLYAELERPAVKKLMDKAAPYFEGKSDMWTKRHCYLVTDSWEGVLLISMPTSSSSQNL